MRSGNFHENQKGDTAMRSGLYEADVGKGITMIKHKEDPTGN